MNRHAARLAQRPLVQIGCQSSPLPLDRRFLGNPVLQHRRTAFRGRKAEQSVPVIRAKETSAKSLRRKAAVMPFEIDPDALAGPAQQQGIRTVADADPSPSSREGRRVPGWCMQGNLIRTQPEAIRKTAPEPATGVGELLSSP